LASLNIEFAKDEELLNEESGKFEEILRKNRKLRKGIDDRKTYSERSSERSSSSVSRKRSNTLKNNKHNPSHAADKNKEDSDINKQSNTKEAEKDSKENTNKEGLESEAVIKPNINLPEELENNKTSDSVSHESSENKKTKKKGKDKRSRKNYDNTLENIFGNGGIIVIAQSLHNPDDVRYFFIYILE
jgi:hypothetical protein